MNEQTKGFDQSPETDFIMKSDIEIARETPLKRIKDVAEEIGIPREEVKLWKAYGKGAIRSDK